jgi:hypothetical protein
LLADTFSDGFGSSNADVDPRNEEEAQQAVTAHPSISNVFAEFSSSLGTVLFFIDFLSLD